MTSNRASERGGWAYASLGVMSGAVALAFGELVAGVGGTRSSPVVVVGDRVIDLAPRPVREAAIAAFGVQDKAALLVGIYALAALFAAGLGLMARRRPMWAAGGLVFFGGVGVAAALAGDTGGLAAVVAPMVAAIVGVAVLRFTVAVLDGSLAVTPSGQVSVATDPTSPVGGAVHRRRFLTLTAGAVVLAASAGSVGRLLQRQGAAAASRLAVLLPRAARPAPPIPASADLGVAGISAVVTPNAAFYRIDTALFVPQVAAETWRLKIHGRVRRPFQLTYDDILRRPLVEEDITMACVSNELGGSLVGNARWLGISLLDLLEEAGIDSVADQVVARSVDGFTAGFPVESLRDGRAALLAVGMNGEPLPLTHGFPARVVVAGLYGYVSATKWLSDLELGRMADFDPYWIRRGWAREGPVKTMARIDTPRAGRAVAPGMVAIGGVAWAPTRGITGVEVRVGQAAWVAAELATEVNPQVWRQWRFAWTATPGVHKVSVRATDGNGETQPEERRPPFPDGATGWHTITVRVR